ncbi:hypothetical protein LJ737_15275 [Hymenobacter sp. 15J16-1T3B]|uniref:hypothetical protein n=1 Tax=Hymenobacter sp. 15J16-1T3B TaxID=2886941 RepID=UPI001D115F21|nr:hypothetical protein [Hymenobacter sp. 15J16-1T3B]MCC3158610.1 hypothetical protein [Hymenobacter sp. 15J16-1T3B]
MSAAPNPLATLAYLLRQPYDLRLEVVMAELLDAGCPFDSLLVRPVGMFARRYRRDLGTVREEEFERTGRPVKRTVLDVNREGLYDALPPHLFHPPGGEGAPQGVSGMVEGIHRQRQQEQSTRLFFLPFEQEFFRSRLCIEQEERRYFAHQSARSYNQTLARFWGIPDTGLPPGPLTNLLYLLPLAHGLVGNLSLTQLCFESVLGHPVQLRVVAPLRHQLFEAASSQRSTAAHPTLGASALGQDMVLSGDYRETLPALEISLKGLSVAELEGYLNQDWPAKVLALLCEYFVAFETDVTIRYEMAVAELEFRLGEGETTALLGFTTGGI